MIGPVALGLGAGAAAGRVAAHPWRVGSLAAICALAPALGAASCVLAWAVGRFRRAAAATRRRRAAAAAALEGAELVALGLAGGLSVAASHRLAARHADSAVRADIDRLVSGMAASGVAVALAADTGPMAGSSAALSTAAASGSPALPALEAYVEHEHHRRHTEEVERARRLPIRLLVPLTLLVLPGFVLITVGPTVADSLARLAP